MLKPTKMAELVRLAAEHAGPISNLVFGAIQGAQVTAKALSKLLQEGGAYKIAYEDAENGSWAWAYDKGGVMRAQGYARDREEALLYAALGAVREEHAAKVVRETLAAANVKVDDTLRQTLESRFITGGHAQLAKDMEAFKQPTTPQ